MSDDGLYKKYDVKRMIDPLGKHADCLYFVLDPQHDPIARHALAYYANRAEIAGNRQLGADLRKWVERCELAASQES